MDSNSIPLGVRAAWIHCLLAFFLACAVSSRGLAQEEGQQKPKESGPNAADLDFFEKEIRPLLVAKCYECHSRKTEDEPGGNLLLDSREGWMTGGDSGPTISLGAPAESLLLKAVIYADSDLKMPPDGKLSDREIASLRRWVELGAPDPRTAAAPSVGPSKIDIEEGRRFWAFQPPSNPALPIVKDVAWPQNGVDRFILAALEAKGVRPAPRADRRTLLRRASFDLIGLPPTPEEMAAFLADDRPGAYARQIERLLASPLYGEKWGRHWLDVARYADSNGLDENVAHGNAWRYRDYVVRSFNADLPFDQFVVEQLAGDLLAADSGKASSHDELIATGFLALGAKVLAESDKVKMRMDIIDEQIDTVGRAFLGLTLGCCRCHDHKFDPIPMQDYYALAGIFKSTTTMESYKTIARWYEHEIPTPEDLERREAHRAAAAAKQKQIETELTAAKSALSAEKAGASGAEQGESSDSAEQDDAKLEEKFPEETRAKLKSLRDELEKLNKETPEISTTMGVVDGEVADAKIHLRGSHLKLGDLAPRGFPQVLQTSAQKLSGERSGRLALARWIVDRDHPLTHRVLVNRLWRWHFGTGLVASTDNFGRLGKRPTHPELLDWLSRRFIESGASIKQMHRRLMLSATYQMSSTYDQAATAKDPENRLRWRMDARRLTAEEIRDSLMFVAGGLDLQMGGNLLPIKNREFIFNHTSQDETSYESSRRSLYLPVIRNHLYTPFSLFDFPDPAVSNGDRSTTTIAPQALFLMNSDLAEQAAKQLAEMLLANRECSDVERIAQLYERALCRPPSDMECDRAAAFLEGYAASSGIGDTQQDDTQQGDKQQGNADEHEQRLAAWRALCQVVLASNEFVYLR